MSFDSKEYIDSYEEYMKKKNFDSYKSMGYIKRGDTLQCQPSHFPTLGLPMCSVVSPPYEAS